MPMPARSLCRPRRRWISLAFGWLALTGAVPARADFAPPPEPSPYRPEGPYTTQQPPDGGWRHEPERWGDPARISSSSLARFHVGPVVLLEPSGPGLTTALDVGERAVGARVSGSWLRAGSEQGLASYAAELWIDFRHRAALHPILGAGASWLRGGALGEDDNVGAGVLRGALEYELPIADADARLGFGLTALVPAIGTTRSRPWATAALTVGAGF